MIKEHDIRPQDLFQRYLDLSRQDAEIFFPNSSDFQQVACVGCEGNTLHPAMRKNGFQYLECANCGSLFVSPRPTQPALDSFYADSPSGNYWAEVFFPSVAEARREMIFSPRVKQIHEHLDARGFSPKMIVEVGAGYGIFLEEYQKRFQGVVSRAVEPSKKLAALCRSKGIETLEVPVEKADAWAETADLVTCFEVIEHVFSPRVFLTAMTRLVRPGGFLLVTGLGVDGFDIQTLWERSKSVSPPHHLNFMSVQAFETLAADMGLTDIQVTTPGKLDLDIVRNEWLEDPAVLNHHRFVKLLLTQRSAEAQAQFQGFLVEHRLSSHVWLLAKKPLQKKELS